MALKSLPASKRGAGSEEGCVCKAMESLLTCLQERRWRQRKWPCGLEELVHAHVREVAEEEEEVATWPGRARARACKRGGRGSTCAAWESPAMRPADVVVEAAQRCGGLRQDAGYGNLSPTTEVAQVLCIFFALFGIPLNLVLLNRIGQLMLSGVQQCAFRLGERFQWQRAANVLTRTCALVVGLLLFLLLPPLLFTAIEGWTYEEGFYYSFITLSTIGFGDYVIGMNPERTYPSWYKNVVSLWILFGMAWLALMINLCISLVENSSGLCRCCKRNHREVEEDLINGNQDGSLGTEDEQNKITKDTKLGGPD
ncbi:hypothetical protein JRQ81_004247 [Phrynocephalus forsythii]|uniref:Potassium channel domain-containing protein n=1 Tax=Phrynocephalus forsythii TaxID=171643 RepID=A0A9Q1B692_9SAUR|nr:hypothetical protein JRQ81_004247 [Phrynocephalus forsythii]